LLSPQWIVKSTDGKLIRGVPAAVKGFSIDSRTIRPGQVFVALKGPNHNSHDYLNEAFERGAGAAVINEGDRARTNKHPNLILVSDTKVALHEMAKAYRMLFQMPLIGVSGSVGKTTTKELLGRLLQTRLNAYYSPGNFNNEIELPLSILNMPFGTDTGVFELATQRPGELKPLANLLGPSISVITAITDAHRGFFESEEQLVNEKWSLVDALPLAGGIVALNADHPALWSRATNQRFRLDFGVTRKAATFRAEHIQDLGLEGMAFTLIYPNGSIPIRTKLLGRHNLYNILAATAVAMEMRVDAQAIRDVVAQMPPYPHRMQWKSSSLGIIVDDCYNASPSAVKAALYTLSAIESEKNKVFVFGDMGEQGDNAVAVHQQVARWVTDTNIKQVFTVGKLAAETAHVLQKQHGWSPSHAKVSSSLNELETHLKQSLCTEDNLILIKGSRSMALDQLVDHLK